MRELSKEEVKEEGWTICYAFDSAEVALQSVNELLRVHGLEIEIAETEAVPPKPMIRDICFRLVKKELQSIVAMCHEAQALYDAMYKHKEGSFDLNRQSYNSLVQKIEKASFMRVEVDDDIITLVDPGREE